MGARRALAIGALATTLLGSVVVWATGAPAAATLPVTVDVSVGNGYACGLLDNGAVKCWGANSVGQLGLGDTEWRGNTAAEMGASLPTVDLGTGRTALSIAAGIDHTCAILDDHTVKCWGANPDGGLGLGDTNGRGDNPGEMGDSLPTVDLGSGRTATAVTAGVGHSCALLDNGTVKCWGAGGELGLSIDDIGDQPLEMGDNLPAIDLGSGRTATAITEGEASACALLDTGSVKCWGLNQSGALGLGDSNNRGDQPGELGEALPAVDLGTGRTAVAISARLFTTCALLDNGAVKCWGFNSMGQLGLGDTTTRGDAAGEMGDSLPAVDLGTGRTATAITEGETFTCALLDNGTVKCWGNNGEGRLGLGDVGRRGSDPGQMGDALPAVDLGTGRTAVAISAGRDHACALLDNAAVKCWGFNGNGELGLGDTSTRGDDPGEMGDALPAVDLGTGLAVTRKVDAEIRKSTQTTYKGDGIYNVTGTGQSVAQDVRRGTTTTYVVRVRNESSSTDGVRVRGTGSSGRFTVTYLVGSTDATAAVVAGTYTFTQVPAGATRKLTVKIRVANNATINGMKAVKITATSTGDSSTMDAVKATVTAVR